MSEKLFTAHDLLCAKMTRLPQDYQPYGNTERDSGDTYGSDCSCGCKHWAPLEGQLGYDWGVCLNPKSHRVGLLTFEHQGCWAFEQEPATEIESDIPETNKPKLITRLIAGWGTDDKT